MAVEKSKKPHPDVSRIGDTKSFGAQHPQDGHGGTDQATGQDLLQGFHPCHFVSFQNQNLDDLSSDINLIPDASQPGRANPFQNAKVNVTVDTAPVEGQDAESEEVNDSQHLTPKRTITAPAAVSFQFAKPSTTARDYTGRRWRIEDDNLHNFYRKNSSREAKIGRHTSDHCGMNTEPKSSYVGETTDGCNDCGDEPLARLDSCLERAVTTSSCGAAIEDSSFGQEHAGAHVCDGKSNSEVTVTRETQSGASPSISSDYRSFTEMRDSSTLPTLNGLDLLKENNENGNNATSSHSRETGIIGPTEGLDFSDIDIDAECDAIPYLLSPATARPKNNNGAPKALSSRCSSESTLVSEQDFSGKGGLGEREEGNGAKVLPATNFSRPRVHFEANSTPAKSNNFIEENPTSPSRIHIIQGSFELHEENRLDHLPVHISHDSSGDGDGFESTQSGNIYSAESSCNRIVHQLLTLLSRESRKEEETKWLIERRKREQLRKEITTLECSNRTLSHQVQLLDVSRQHLSHKLTEAEKHIHALEVELAAEREMQKKLQVSEAECGLQLATIVGNYKVLETQHQGLQREFQETQSRQGRFESQVSSYSKMVSSLQMKLKDQHDVFRVEIDSWKKKAAQYGNSLRERTKMTEVVDRLENAFNAKLSDLAERLQMNEQEGKFLISQTLKSIEDQMSSMLINGDDCVQSRLTALGSLIRDSSSHHDSSTQALMDSVKESMTRLDRVLDSIRESVSSFLPGLEQMSLLSTKAQVSEIKELLVKNQEAQLELNDVKNELLELSKQTGTRVCDLLMLEKEKADLGTTNSILKAKVEQLEQERESTKLQHENEAKKNFELTGRLREQNEKYQLDLELAHRDVAKHEALLQPTLEVKAQLLIEVDCLQKELITIKDDKEALWSAREALILSHQAEMLRERERWQDKFDELRTRLAKENEMIGLKIGEKVSAEYEGRIQSLRLEWTNHSADQSARLQRELWEQAEKSRELLVSKHQTAVEEHKIEKERYICHRSAISAFLEAIHADSPDCLIVRKPSGEQGSDEEQMKLQLESLKELGRHFKKEREAARTLAATCSSLESSLQEKSLEIQKLDTVLKETRSVILPYQEKESELELKVRELERQVQKLECFEKECLAKDQLIEVLQDRIDEYRNREAKQSTGDDLQQRLEQQRNKFEADISALRQQIERLTREKEDAFSLVDQINEESDTVRKDLELRILKLEKKLAAARAYQVSAQISANPKKTIPPLKKTIAGKEVWSSPLYDRSLPTRREVPPVTITLMQPRNNSFSTDGNGLRNCSTGGRSLHNRVADLFAADDGLPDEYFTAPLEHDSGGESLNCPGGSPLPDGGFGRGQNTPHRTATAETQIMMGSVEKDNSKALRANDNGGCGGGGIMSFRDFNKFKAIQPSSDSLPLSDIDDDDDDGTVAANRGVGGDSNDDDDSVEEPLIPAGRPNSGMFKSAAATKAGARTSTQALISASTGFSFLSSSSVTAGLGLPDPFVESVPANSSANALDMNKNKLFLLGEHGASSSGLKAKVRSVPFGRMSMDNSQLNGMKFSFTPEVEVTGLKKGAVMPAPPPLTPYNLEHHAVTITSESTATPTFGSALPSLPPPLPSSRVHTGKRKQPGLAPAVQPDCVTSAPKRLAGEDANGKIVGFTAPAATVGTFRQRHQPLRASSRLAQAAARRAGISKDAYPTAMGTVLLTGNETCTGSKPVGSITATVDVEADITAPAVLSAISPPISGTISATNGAAEKIADGAALSRPSVTTAAQSKELGVSVAQTAEGKNILLPPAVVVGGQGLEAKAATGVGPGSNVGSLTCAGKGKRRAAPRKNNKSARYAARFAQEMASAKVEDDNGSGESKRT